MAQQVYEMTLNDFIEIAASKSHTPGGGNVSAVVATLGASMVAMVGNLTVGKKTYAQVQDRVTAIAERDMAPANSWQVRLDENGKLLWESDAGVVTRQPAQSWWQRVQAWFFKIAPEGQL